mmetsp:Transcript_7096/g.18384  ORF Transcript_7096/g.18384 Transcript_7096/m.18384 type:complete len:89 (-) Transcript_7096:742-1008(-)
MRSALTTVDRRWATEIDVRPTHKASMASCTRASDSASNAEVASSKSSSRGAASNARAMATRCVWPPLSRTPRSPTAVSNPSGNAVAKS